MTFELKEEATGEVGFGFRRFGRGECEGDVCVVAAMVEEI